MARRRSRGRVLGVITDNGLVAFNCGYSCHRADMDPGEVRSMVERHGFGNMTPDEVRAYNALLPATFWAQFNRGWESKAKGDPAPEGLVQRG